MVLGLTWLATTKNNVKRLLVEAKFYAALLQDQASGYAQQFDEPGPTVLLFICPEVRIPTLWAAIRQQIGKRWELETIDSSVWRQEGWANWYRATVGACQLGSTARKDG